MENKLIQIVFDADGWPVLVYPDGSIETFRVEPVNMSEITLVWENNSKEK